MAASTNHSLISLASSTPTRVSLPPLNPLALPEGGSIRFEHIDGDIFFEIYNGCRVPIHLPSGFLNATYLAQLGNTKFRHWLETLTSQEYIACLSKNMATEDTPPLYQSTTWHTPHLIFLMNNVAVPSSNLTKGYYVHPSLATEVARWISPQMSVDVSAIVETNKILKTLQKYNVLKDMYETAVAERDQLSDTVQTLEARYQAVKPHITVALDTPGLKHQFILLRLIDAPFAYMVIRAQRRAVNSRLKRLERRQIQFEELHRFEYVPNAVNILNKFREAHTPVARRNCFDVAWSKDRLVQAFTEVIRNHATGQ